MKKRANPHDLALTQRGIKALDRALGTVGAHRFLTLLRPKSADYVKTSRRLYAGQSVDKIFVRCRARNKMA